MCTWQLARTAWLWAKAVVGIEYTITPAFRITALLMIVGLLAAVLYRVGGNRLGMRLVEVLRSLRAPALVLALLATGITAARPPEFLRHLADGPAATNASLPDIYLITLDTLTAIDANVCDKNGDSVMPRLRAFASGSHCFDRFYTSSNFTTPTVATMETGLQPWSHFATQPDATVIEAQRSHTLPRALAAIGYRTHSITDNLLASPRHRGTYDSYHSTEFAHTTLAGNILREAMTVLPRTQLPKLVAAAMSFRDVFETHLHGEANPYDSRRTYQAVFKLLEREAGRRPQFIWAHSLPPHSPYLPPPQTKYRLLPKGELERWQDLLPDNITYAPAQQPLVDKHRLRYRELIMASDEWLGDFLDELQRRGKLDAALVIVTSDHGESFEKGYYGHAGPMLHDAVTRVPLIVKLPGQRTGQIVDTVSGQADLAPTIIDLAGAGPLPHAEGRSLRPMLDGKALPPRPVYTMSMERQSRFRPLQHGRFAVIDGDFKYEMELDGAHSALFDLRADPSETRDVSALHTQTAKRLQTLIRLQIGNAERVRAQAR